MMVPPARTRGGAGLGFRGRFCEAVQIDEPGIKTSRYTNSEDNVRGNKCGNLRLRDDIVRVFLILLHGDFGKRFRLNVSVRSIQL